MINNPIAILRNSFSPKNKTCLPYSIGKDSSVLLHLARKAFYPARLLFTVVHVNISWKFRKLYQFRDETCKSLSLYSITYSNPERITAGINPFTNGSSVHKVEMKTQTLKQVLDHYGFNVILDGARRDEKKSRAKEPIILFRSFGHLLDSKR